MEQYYSNKRNLFWKLVTEVIREPMPESYEDKINLILKKGIALWDVCMTCIRDGSLDSNITDEAPNVLQSFIVQHPNIKLIAFNGKEAAKLFGKHIRSIQGIKLLVLPSTSPANAGVSMETKLTEWGKLKNYI